MEIYIYAVVVAMVIVQVVMWFFIIRSIREKRLFESFFTLFVVMPLVFVTGMRYVNNPNELFDQVRSFSALYVRVFNIAGMWGVLSFFVGGFLCALFIHYSRRRGMM